MSTKGTKRRKRGDRQTNELRCIHSALLPKRRKKVKRDRRKKEKKIRSSNKRWLASGEEQNSLSLKGEREFFAHACI
jgi:hypothetical protein